MFGFTFTPSVKEEFNVENFNVEKFIMARRRYDDENIMIRAMANYLITNKQTPEEFVESINHATSAAWIISIGDKVNIEDKILALKHLNMFKDMLELQHPIMKGDSLNLKGEVIDTIHYCESCLNMINETVRLREYAAQFRTQNLYENAKMFVNLLK